MGHDSTVLAQFLKPLPRHGLEFPAKRHHKDRKLRSMTRWNSWRWRSGNSSGAATSAIVSKLPPQRRKLYHLGFGASLALSSSLVSSASASPWEP